MRVMKWSMIALAVSAGTSQFAMASDQSDSKGFVDDSSFSINTTATTPPARATPVKLAWASTAYTSRASLKGPSVWVSTSSACWA
jgi:hypothetical protein